MPDLLLIVDMQTGLFEDGARHDAAGVVARINALLDAARAAQPNGAAIAFVQHDGEPGEPLEPGAPGWSILPALHRLPEDPVLRKRSCDAFLHTGLDAHLRALGVDRLIVAGCCTDFCIDATIRAAAGRGVAVFAPEDGHTTGDRPHLAAPGVIAHHNWIWRRLLVPGPAIVVAPAARLPDLLGWTGTT